VGRVHLASQFLHSHLHPRIDDRDLRHPDDTVLLYNIKDDFVARPGVKYTPGAEHTGVTHLVDAWFPRGHYQVS
jgi:hypothetical protein